MEGRATMLDVVARVAEVTTVPFTVGGGISDVKSAEAVLNAGANKVSTSSPMNYQVSDHINDKPRKPTYHKSLYMLFRS